MAYSEQKKQTKMYLFIYFLLSLLEYWMDLNLTNDSHLGREVNELGELHTIALITL